MSYSRINLSVTNYDMNKLDLDARILRGHDVDTDILESIYNTYVIYKNFDSVMPLFPEEYCYPMSDVIGYYDDNKLVAFSLMFRYNSKNVAALQFAWTYSNPKSRIGIKSMKWECAYYKSLGYDYVYLGDANAYKQHIDGFEICPPR